MHLSNRAIRSVLGTFDLLTTRLRTVSWVVFSILFLAAAHFSDDLSLRYPRPPDHRTVKLKVWPASPLSLGMVVLF